MIRGHDTHHSSFSMTARLAALVVTAGSLLLASCATSPESAPTPDTKVATADETVSAETDKSAPPEKTEVATAEKAAPSKEATPENGEEKDAAAVTSPAASYPGAQDHIKKIEGGLKPLKSIPSKRD